jgi:hypothetical protein
LAVKKTTTNKPKKDKQPQPSVRELDEQTMECASGGGFVCQACACTR